MSGGGGGGDDGVDYQREQEQARQARIREGMARIDELFNGKQVLSPTTAQKVQRDEYYGMGPGTFYDDAGNATTYTTTNQKRFKKGHGFTVDTANGKQIVPVSAYTTDPRLSQVASKVGGFGDDFFNKRATAYQDFALPQVQQQYEDQQKALTFALARGGNIQSSLSSDKNAELDKDYGLQKQAVYDTGQDYVNQGKADLASQKASAVSLLQATADPDAAYNVAQTSANQLSAMPAFQPLNSVVKNVASGLGTYLNNQSTADAIAKAQQGSAGGYSLPASWSGSGKVGR